MNNKIIKSTAAEAITMPAINVTNPEQDNFEASSSLSPSLFKCKSMLSIVKPITSNTYKNKHFVSNAENQLGSSSKNLSINGSPLGNQLSLLSSTNLVFSSSRRLSRKCLSRINLNLLNSNKTFDYLQSPHNQHQHQHQATSMSIMNLDKYLKSPHNNSYYTDNENKLQSNRLYYFKSSEMNLSTSLNALLDLDMLDSVSIGSFDRHSLYSLCGPVMSDCDLSAICLFGDQSTNDLFNSTSHQGASHLDLAIGKSKTKPNSKVIDWLQKI